MINITVRIIGGVSAYTHQLGVLYSVSVRQVLVKDKEKYSVDLHVITDGNLFQHLNYNHLIVINIVVDF